MLFCDSRFTTNVQSDTASQICVPSFSAVMVEIGISVVPAIILAIVKVSYQQTGRSKRSQRLRFQLAPLKVMRGFGSYLPYAILEHAQLPNGSLKTVWVEPSCIVDGHFVVPVQGLESSVPFDEVLPFRKYNGRRGSLLYYSIAFANYDLGTIQWSEKHTERYYSELLPADQDDQRIHKDRKVFLSKSDLRTHQTVFGFDEHIVHERRYRKGPKTSTSADSRPDPLQPKISTFYRPIPRPVEVVSATVSSSSSDGPDNLHIEGIFHDDDDSVDPLDLFEGDSSDDSNVDDDEDEMEDLLSGLR